MSRTTTSRLAEREQLHQAVTSAKQHARDAELAHHAAERAVETLNEQVIDAHAAGDEAQAKALKRKRTTAQERLRDSAEMLEGARRRVTRSELELERFSVSNLDEMLAEREPAQEAVARGVEDTIAAVVQAVGAWHAEAAFTTALLRDARATGARVPDLPGPVAQLVRDIRRGLLGTAVPRPMPGGQQVPVIGAAPRHDDTPVGQWATVTGPRAA